MCSIPESKYFPHDKESLLKALTGFDGDITVDDVTDGVKNRTYNAKHYHTVLLQILLEFICNDLVKAENQREIVLKELCSRLATIKFVNSSLLMDKNNPLRIEIKKKFFDFVAQIIKEVIPGAEVDAGIGSFLENSNLTANPDLLFYNCFEQLEEIGRGGYGVVYKAKNKVTHHVHAVKKILFNYKNDARYLEVMREAKHIAAVNHPNVVRYFNAWIEVLPSDSDLKQFSCASRSNTDDSKNEDDISFCDKGVSAIVITDKYSKTSLNSLRTSESHTWKNRYDCDSNGSSESVIFSDSVEKISGNIDWTLRSDNESPTREMVDGTTNDSDSSDETTNASDSSDETTNASDSSDETSNDNDSSNETTNVSNMPVKLNLNVRGILYIQMEYCDCDLRFWLDERAKGHKLPFDMDVTEIFTNILNGLDHIHSKGIIHRDLKPQNIFYSNSSNFLKIGDFGLATLHVRSTNSKNKSVSDLLSCGLGTRPYAAPEQLGSNSYGSYDSKVDMYSLGIILIELMNTISTVMEFTRVIKDIENGTISEEMKKLPHLVKLVTNLISINPHDRMSAEDIVKDTKVQLKEVKKALEEKDIERATELVTQLKIAVHQKDEEKDLELKRMSELVTQLEIAVHQKDEEIARLRAIMDTTS